ncbi:MAG: sensor histidine kinase, partial [Deltaproteobacteria bacterium]
EKKKAQVGLILSHELKTPITIAKAYCDLLEQGSYGTFPPNQREILAIVREAVARMNTMTDAILEMASADLNKRPSRFERTSLPKLIGSVLRELGPIFTLRELALRVDVPQGLPDILIEPEEIRQVIENLLLNAIRFTPDGGRVEIEAGIIEEEGIRKVRISVRDDGIGIPPEERHSIFRKFYEVGDSMTHSSGSYEFGSAGLGLGLAIAKRYVENHRGQIEVESEVGKGSCFFFTIPV